MIPERILLKMARRERLAAQLAELDREIAAGCREYSIAQGCTFLTPEQVRRSIEYRGREAA